MYSILPILIRRAVNDYIVNDDPKYKIDKGMPVIIPSCGFHMDPDYYPEPHIFNPDNFSPENIKLREHSAFLAFGDGPRNCIGMRFGRIQVRLGIAMLLQKYKFVIGPDTAIPVQIDKNSSFCTSRGIRLYIENV